MFGCTFKLINNTSRQYQADDNTYRIIKTLAYYVKLSDRKLEFVNLCLLH